MERNESLFDMQYGFRKGRSCEHALLAAQNCILDTLNKNEIALLLLIDFSKAFDMVDHDILLSKLSRYGIRGNALKWMQSYLRGRRQYVTIDGKNSSERDLKFGVPQGSILGPLLFIIYINDLPNIHKFAKFILYADDANIIITGKDVQEISEHALTIHNVIVKNALLFMYKCHRQRGQVCHYLPPSMVATIRDDAPSFDSTHETCNDWLVTYSTKSFCKSLFYKGPLLFNDIMQIETLSLSLISAKNAIKKQLLIIQSSGESEEWLNQNFKLYNIRGLRKSTRMTQL
jgi:hypothetical protein